MIHEELEEQASLYVLGMLEREEARAFEEQLAGSEELREHVRSLEDTAAQLAHVAPARPVPAALEGRIMAEIRAAAPAPPSNITPLRMVWLPWAIAACLAIACVVAFSQRQRLADQLSAAESEAAAAKNDVAAAEARAADAQTQVAQLAVEKERAEQQVVELRQREADSRVQMATLAAARDEATQKVAQLEARQGEGEARPPTEDRPDADALSNVQVATLTSKMKNAPKATAAVVWDAARQRGVLNSANMPPNSADRDYQLWIVDSRFSDPVDGGVFRVEKNGSTRYVFKPKIRIEAPAGFAVSVERRGGVAKAEGPIVLASN